jgi:hypothetical protein
MVVFLENRDKDIEFLNHYIPHFEFEEWTQFKDLQSSLDACSGYCKKHKLKSITSETFFSSQTLNFQTQPSLKRNQSNTKLNKGFNIP